LKKYSRTPTPDSEGVRQRMNIGAASRLPDAAVANTETTVEDLMK
jgi:hypothetical protein